MARPSASGQWGPATLEHRRLSGHGSSLHRKSSYTGSQTTFWPWLVLTQVGGKVFFLWITDDILAMARPSESGWRGLYILDHR
jgi:hypothetical protein